MPKKKKKISLLDSIKFRDSAIILVSFSNARRATASNKSFILDYISLFIMHVLIFTKYIYIYIHMYVYSRGYFAEVFDLCYGF